MQRPFFFGVFILSSPISTSWSEGQLSSSLQASASHKIQQLQQSDSGMLRLQQSDKHLFLWGAGQRPQDRHQTRRHQVGHFV
jgi:hypothetical protein